VVTDNFVLRNRQLLVAANRYMPFYRHHTDDKKIINLTTK
jgi:hypothetical protein